MTEKGEDGMGSCDGEGAVIRIVWGTPLVAIHTPGGCRGRGEEEGMGGCI